MEMELQDLITKIKNDGVKKAEEQARDIVKATEKKSAGMIEDAKRKSDEIIRAAKAETDNYRNASEKALKQSARDVLLTLRERVTEFFERIVKEDAQKALTTDALADMITKAVENFSKDAALDIEILVSEEDRGRVEKALFAKMRQEANKKFTVQTSDAVDKGFRIGEKGKNSYYDFSGAAITEALTKYLNPRLAELLDLDLGIEKDTHGQ